MTDPINLEFEMPAPDLVEAARKSGKPVSDPEPAYYDIPFLKKPVWKWEIAVYFFLGGLSAGAFVLARLAGRSNQDKHAQIRRVGTFVAALAVIPCAPLLIADLGDPRRFHHMLRVIKPISPMNLGSWTLAGYTALTFTAAASEWIQGRPRLSLYIDKYPRPFATLVDFMDLTGIPFAIVLAGYTGVLLSTTSNPLWSKNRYLGALFSASAMHCGSSAIRLALESGVSDKHTGVCVRALRQFDSVASIAEAASLCGFMSSASELAAPLVRGKYAPHFLGGAVAAGLLFPELVERLPLRRAAWIRRFLPPLLALVGGLLLRWSFVFGGHVAADDPYANRRSSRDLAQTMSPPAYNQEGESA